jgi:hypothetical protein
VGLRAVQVFIIIKKIPKGKGYMKTFTFTEFAPRYFLAWTISSQCYNTSKVTIRLGSSVLAEAYKDKRDCGFTMLNQAHADINSKTSTSTSLDGRKRAKVWI